MSKDLDNARIDAMEAMRILDANRVDPSMLRNLRAYREKEGLSTDVMRGMLIAFSVMSARISPDVDKIIRFIKLLKSFSVATATVYLEDIEQDEKNSREATLLLAKFFKSRQVEDC